MLGKWFEDGPFLPVEFVRQSSNGRLTLVLVPGSAVVRTLWVPLAVETIAEATEALRGREGVTEKNVKKHIGVWSIEEQRSSGKNTIAIWARGLQLQGVIWTALPPRFDDQDGKMPSADEAVDYLRQLTDEPRRDAERYVRMTPRQIDTPYRRRFEAELGWRSEDW